MTNLGSILKSDTSLCQQSPYSQSYGFSSSHIWMWEWDNKRVWALKNWCFWIVVLEKTLENPLDCMEIEPVSPKENHWKDWCWSWSSNTLGTWCTDLTPGKGPDAGKDWRQEKRMTEDKMVGWHHWLDGHEFEQAPGVGDGQGSLACCSPWGHKESDTTERLNNNNGKKPMKTLHEGEHNIRP